MPHSTRPDAAASPLTAIGAAELRAIFGAAARALGQQAGSLDAINVFPIPDGDTGANMSLTMTAVADAVERAPADAEVPSLARIAAEAALMGARGNSGVILSQIIGGLAVAVTDARVDGRALADGLRRGCDAAYRAVTEPREGTMLTAIAAAARAAEAAANAGFERALGAAADAAEAAALRSPELLAVLREAGVVDAGAQGLSVMLAGMFSGVRGGPVAAAGSFGAIDAAWLAARAASHDDDEPAGYCTEFVLRAPHLDAGALRDALAALGTSLLIVEHAGAARVHLHTIAPQAALEVGRQHGAVSSEKVDDMQAQARALLRDRTPEGPALPFAVVAVAPGDGIARLFRGLGATVVAAGATMIPGVRELAAAIAGAARPQAVVLPNDPDIIAAASQAVTVAASSGDGQRARMIATRSVPQGLAALLAVDPTASFQANVAAMERAGAAARSGDVMRAVRDTSLDGAPVRAGDWMALVDARVVSSTATAEEAVRACLHAMVDNTSSVVTLFTGAGVPQGEAARLAEDLRREFRFGVDVIDGGQPHTYLIGVE